MPGKEVQSYPGNENYKPGTWEYLLSENPEKRKGEIFFWKWNVCWLVFFAGIVITSAYEHFGAWSYLNTGLIICIPPVFGPLLFPQLSGEQNTKWYDRYTTKANIWIVVYAFIGNYYWTHYFYKVLGCDYTLETFRINDVPICMFLITIGYFHFYHGLSSILLRKLWRSEMMKNKSTVTQYIIVSLFIGIGSYFTAILEAGTIASFPYYTYPDTKAMFLIGSVFYAIYFLGSFPSFLRLDEYIGKAQFAALAKKKDGSTTDVNAQVITDVHCTALSNSDGYRFTLSATLVDVLAYSMYTTTLLDVWRLNIGQVNGEMLDRFVSWIY